MSLLANNEQSQKGYLLITVVVTLFILAAIVLLINREGSVNVSMVGAQQQMSSVQNVTQAGMQHAIWLANNSNCSAYSLPKTSFGEHSYTATYSPASGSPVSIVTNGILASGLSHVSQRDSVPIYQPKKEVILQPDPATGKDTHIYQWKSTWNYGTDPNLSVDGSTDSIDRPLISFDLSSIPVGVKVISASLDLHSNSNSWGSTSVDVLRVTRDWAEGSAKGGNGSGANWNEAKTGTNWSNSGGDFYPTIMTSATTPGAVGWVSWDMTQLVDDWVNKRIANYGVMLRTTGYFKGAQFDSSDAVNPAGRPKLTITFACECGKVCDGPPIPSSCNADYLANTKISEFSTSGYGSTVQKDLDYIPEDVSFFGIKAPAGGAWISVDRSSSTIYLNDMAGSVLSSASGTGSMGGVAYVSSGTWAGHLAVSDFSNDDVRFYNKDGVVVASFSLSGYMVGTPSGAAFIKNTNAGIYNDHLAITDRPKNLIYIANQAGILKTTLDLSAYASGLTDVAHIPNSDKLLVLDETRKVYILNMDGSKSGEYDISSYGTSGTVGLAINPLTCDHVIGDDGVDKVISLNTSNVGAGSSVMLSSHTDTFLRGGSSTNYGNSDAIMSGRDNGGPLFYGLMGFDVSSLPAGASISAARLRLYQFTSKKSGHLTIGVHRIDQDWTEAGANWTTTNGTTAWSGGVGGTYTNPSVSSTDVSIGSYTWYEWDLTTLVQEWVDGVSPNYGLQLIYENANGGENVSFASKEHADSSLRPQLLIDYTAP